MLDMKGLLSIYDRKPVHEKPIYQGKPEGYKCDLLDVKTTSSFPLSGNMAGKPSQESSKMLWSR